MARLADLRVKYEVELTVIRPGDTALVRVPRDMPPERAEKVAERLRERMPDVEVVVLAGVDGIDVYRPDGTGGPHGGQGTGSEGSGAAAAP